MMGDAVELQTEAELPSPNISLKSGDLMIGILGLLGLPGTEHLNAEEFWSLVASSFNVRPAEATIGTAQAVFASIGEDWDEDFENDGRPSLAALEALHERLSHHDFSDVVGEQDEDEDDDAAIDAQEVKFSVTRLDFPISSLIAMVSADELILNPEWQRNFVWTTKKMRRLIESVLLKLPLPSLLLYRDSVSGKIYVIDGRQRLETLSRYCAPKEKKGDERIRFRTFPASTDGWKEGQPLHAAASKYYGQLPLQFKTLFDTSALVCIIFENLQLASLYQIFKRYNTGAVALNAAEIRNAVYQTTSLHQMMYRMAGEQGATTTFKDDDEKTVSELLRHTMKKKVARYGAYDFIGRFFAFRYMSAGSVAKATNDFMDKYSKNDASIEPLRRSFIDAFNATLRWYDTPLVKSSRDPIFHAFLATVQTVTSSMVLELIEAGKMTEETVKARIDRSWANFAESRTQEKQNSTLFWGAQQDWLDVLTGKA